MRVFLATLGCPKNVVDSENMAAQLALTRHEIVEDPRQADVIIVNTCGFIEPARRESLEVLRELTRGKRRRQRVIAAGCLAQRWGTRLLKEMPAVDALLSTRRWDEITRLVDVLSSRTSPGEPIAWLDGVLNMEKMPAPGRPFAGPSAYLKIADGCSASCSFCSIPLIKGPARSRPREHIVAEARELVDAGARELILIAQDITAYGADLGIEDALPDLIEHILKAVPELDWLRLMYAYPQRITPRLIEVMAGHPQVCHYLDIPLQHGHPEVLRRMRRPHDLDKVLAQIEALRAAMPDIALRTSLIVGFPGETEAEFQTLLEFVDAIAFDWVGAFVFSPEEGTPAAAMPGQVPDEVKQTRYAQLMERQQSISLRRNQEQVGRILDMLVEGVGDGISVGRTYRDAPEIDGLILVEGEAEVGDFLPVRVISASEYDLWGEWVSQETGRRR
ncbi:MAG: 30S ribosomal protein S12 methylthiotransferase RimO [Anaerolineae bacterium]